MLSQLVAAPVMITSCALIGVVVTSASSQILGLGQAELIWNPIFLLGRSSLPTYSQSLISGRCDPDSLWRFTGSSSCGLLRWSRMHMRSIVYQCHPKRCLYRDGPRRFRSQIHKHQARGSTARCPRSRCQPLATHRHRQHLHRRHFRFRNLYRSNDWYHVM